MKKILIPMFLVLIPIIAKNVDALEATPGESAGTPNQFVNAQNVLITEDRFLELMDAGYTIDEIYAMDLDTYNNANTNNPNAAVTTKYYKTTTTTLYGTTTTETTEVTEQEYLNSDENSQVSIAASGTVETTYKRMTASITDTSNSSRKLYKVYMYWKQMPSTRSYDIIGLGYQSSLVELYLQPTFKNLYTYGGTTYVDDTNIPKANTSGRGAVFPLPSNTISTLCQELSFEVIKVDSSETISSLTACGDYAHATSSVSSTTANNNYSIDTLGLYLNSTINSKYDAIDVAQVYYNSAW